MSFLTGQAWETHLCPELRAKEISEFFVTESRTFGVEINGVSQTSCPNAALTHMLVELRNSVRNEKKSRVRKS